MMLYISTYLQCWPLLCIMNTLHLCNVYSLIMTYECTVVHGCIYSYNIRVCALLPPAQRGWYCLQWCLFVCLFVLSVNLITPEPLDILS